MTRTEYKRNWMRQHRDSIARQEHERRMKLTEIRSGIIANFLRHPVVYRTPKPQKRRRQITSVFRMKAFSGNPHLCLRIGR